MRSDDTGVRSAGFLATAPAGETGSAPDGAEETAAPVPQLLGNARNVALFQKSRAISPASQGLLLQI